MKHKPLSSSLSIKDNKSLSKWEEAISEAKRRIATLKNSIRTFEYLRDSGMEFPEPKKRRGRKQNGAKA